MRFDSAQQPIPVIERSRNDIGLLRLRSATASVSVRLMSICHGEPVEPCLMALRHPDNYQDRVTLVWYCFGSAQQPIPVIVPIAIGRVEMTSFNNYLPFQISQLF